MGAGHGLAAALKEDADGADAPDGAPEAAEQLAFEEMLAGEVAEMDAPGGYTLPGESPRKGPGRPKGKRNESTEQTKRVIRAIGGDAHLAAARIVAGGPAWLIRQAQAAWVACYGGPVDEAGRPIILEEEGEDGAQVSQVREVLGVRDALQLHMRAIEFLGPYLMAKAPTELEIRSDGLNVSILLGGFDGAEPDIVGGQRQAAGGYTLPAAAEPAKSITYDAPPGEVTQSEGHTEGESDD